MDDKELVRMVGRLRRLEANGRAIKAEAEVIREQLRTEFEARGVREIKAGRYVVRAIEYTRDAFSATTFREAYPEMYVAYCKPQTVRRIEVTG